MLDNNPRPYVRAFATRRTDDGRFSVTGGWIAADSARYIYGNEARYNGVGVIPRIRFGERLRLTAFASRYDQRFQADAGIIPADGIGCSMIADQVAPVEHLNVRDTTLAFVSRATQADIARVKARMDWKMPWYTLTDSFDADFGVAEWHGTNAFIRDRDCVFRTYFVKDRGDEQMGNTWSYLDLTALGRQEEWED